MNVNSTFTKFSLLNLILQFFNIFLFPVLVMEVDEDVKEIIDELPEKKKVFELFQFVFYKKFI